MIFNDDYDNLLRNLNLFHNIFYYSMVLDITQKISPKNVLSKQNCLLMVIFLYNLYIFVGIQHVCFA